MGDVDVKVLICDSHNDCQWCAGLMLSAGQKSPQKPPGFQITSALEIWWANLCFSYCTSHFSYQNDGCERTSCSFCMCKRNIAVCETYVCLVALSEYKSRITYSSLLISQLPTKMKQLYAHNQHFKICHYLKFTKKGKWKHNALCSHHSSHWLTVTDENCPGCSQKANWHFISSDWG